MFPLPRLGPSSPLRIQLFANGGRLVALKNKGTAKEGEVFFSSRRRHTICLSDWSSDVCSSDLALFVTNLNQLAQIDGIIRKYGLDKPAHVQYWIWLKELARGDLGWSQTARMPTSAAIGTFFPATLELTIYIFIPVVLIGLWLGTKAAVHKDRFVDHFSRFVGISLRGLPSFVWGLVVLMVF